MKKHDKLVILIVLGILSIVMTWFVGTGSYSNGEFSLADKSMSGIFDYLLVIFYAMYYKASDIFYLFVLGGVYGVLSQTSSYRKLVTKTVKLIKGKEIWAMLLITLLMGIVVSISNQILTMLIFVPFIVTVFLKRGKDRLTAISAAFGGIFIGTIGLTFGTYGMKQFLSIADLTVVDGIVPKIIMFVLTYALFNLFAILHMKKNKDIVNETSYDMFTTQKLDETNVKVNKRKKVWPIVLIFAIVSIISICAYIDWSASFNVEFFSNLYADISNIKINDTPVVMQVLGSFNAFGEWNETLPLTVVLIIATIIIALIDKVKFSDYVDNFGLGMKKISKVIMLYIFAMSIFIISYYFGWTVTLINKLFGSGHLNIFVLIIIAILATLFFVDNDYIGYMFGDYMKANFADHIVGTTLAMQFGYGLASVFVPSSAILMIALSYLDIPYTKWLKYIWKFLLAMLIVILITVAIVIYV